MFSFRTRSVLYLLLFLLPVHSSFATIYYVNTSNATPGAGTSWATAFNDLNSALAVAGSPDEIWVAQGTYKPTTTTNRTATFKVISFCGIYGGFTGTETLRTQRNPKTNITILSGDIGITGDASDNSYNVVTIATNGKMLDGFTIRDGNANAGYPGSTTPQPNNSGGGVLVQGGAGVNSYGILDNCVITSNFAVYGGGFCSYANGGPGQSMYEVSRTLFDNNTAVMGGAIALVIMNSAYGNGLILNSIFTNNNSLNAQGSVMASMYDNGSGGSLQSSMHNSTLYNNTAPVIYNQQAGTFISVITGQNDIIWKSGAPYAASSLTAGPNISLFNCDLDLVTPTSGNFNDDPQFVNAAGNDLHVNCSSPVVDAGVNLSLVTTDFDGNPRPQGNGKDIGAYETGRPLAPVVANVTICQYATASALTATPASGNTLLWYTAASGGTGSATAPVPTTTGAGTQNYYVSQVDPSGCEGPRANIKAIINAGAAMPAASNVTYCLNDVATALTATGTNLLWYTASTGGSGSSTAPVPSTASAGTTDWYVTQTPAGSCESARMLITVTVNNGAATPTAASPTWCLNATATALTATGSNLLWYTASSGGTGSSTAPVPSTASAGTTDWYVTQTPAGSCESARTLVTVTINNQPVAPATAPVNYCQNATAVPLTATGSGLLWYTMPTGGSGTATAPTPSTTAAGTTTYYVSQTIGCESPLASIVVTVGSQAGAPTAGSPTWCQNATATALTATGSNLLWYTAASGGTGISTAPVPSTTSAGTTDWYVTQTPAGSCESARTLITVTINSQPVAPATAPVNYCQNATAVPLTATGSGLLWYTIPAGGSGTATAPTPSTTAAGTTTYYVSQTIGCESPLASIVVTVGSQAAAPIAGSPIYCQNATATALTATGSNLLWYTASSGGTGISTAPVPSTTSSGTTDWYVTQTPAGSCESARTLVTVTVNNGAATPTAASPAWCLNATATALTATGSNLLWYTAATGGTGISTAPVPSTTSAGTTDWYVTQTPAGSCESARTLVTVTINSQPVAPATAPVNYCQNATAVPLTATGSGLLWYTIPAGGSGTVTAPTPSTTAAGTTTYYVSQTLGCESPLASIVVTVGSQATAPIATSPIYCQNATAAALTATGSNLLWYTVATGGTGIAVAPIPSTTAAGTTTYYVSQTIGCESPRTLVTITVNANPAASFDWSPACAGAASTISAMNMTVAPGNYVWDFGNPVSVSGSGAGPYQVVWNAGGDYAVTLTAVTGTCQNMTTHNVIVYPPAQVDISPVTVQLCAGGSVTLNATGASIYQWSPATGLSNADISNPIALLKNDIRYTVTGADNNGCIDIAQISLKPNINCLGYNIPDAFTPNSDGHNDLFRVHTADAPHSFHMMIFNRYGQKVFESRDVQTGWDGTLGSNRAMAGAYVYTVVIKTSAGTTIEKKGTVMLIR